MTAAPARQPVPDPPAAAGYIAGCRQCGTTVGPVTSPSSAVRVTVSVLCGCGQLLEAWPSPAAGGPGR